MGADLRLRGSGSRCSRRSSTVASPPGSRWESILSESVGRRARPCDLIDAWRRGGSAARWPCKAARGRGASFALWTIVTVARSSYLVWCRACALFLVFLKTDILAKGFPSTLSWCRLSGGFFHGGFYVSLYGFIDITVYAKPKGGFPHPGCHVAVGVS